MLRRLIWLQEGLKSLLNANWGLDADANVSRSMDVISIMVVIAIQILSSYVSFQVFRLWVSRPENQEE